MGPTLVWYLLGVGTIEPGGWEARAVEEGPTAGLAARAVTATAVAIAAREAAAAEGAAVEDDAAAGAAALELPVREGEERRNRGRKARPPRVFTMLEPENEKKWRGVGEANERSWPINGHKCLLNG